MSDNKFIKRLKGEQTAKSVLEIKNESAKTSFANMPKGTSNALNVYSDHRGNATAVLEGTDIWKLNNSQFSVVPNAFGDGRDFTSTYTVAGSSLWVNATHTFDQPKIFTGATQWTLKLCGHSLLSRLSNTIGFSLIIKFGNAVTITKSFSVSESAFEFCKEFIIDFSESEQSAIKVANGDTMTVQLLCADATASATIYNGMTTLVAQQRRVDGEAVASDLNTFEDIEVEVAQLREDLDDLEEYVDDTFVRLDGTSIMTAPLKFMSGSFRGAVGPYLNGVSFWKMDAQGAITNYANFTDSTFWPVTTNAIDLGRSANKWKDLYLAGKAYISVINNGYDIAVPVTNSADSLALKSQVDDAANSGEQLYTTGVWYAKMYAATVVPTGAEYDGRNYADFSQTDSDGNPVIKIYTGASGAWTLTDTIVPPANHNGYMTITSKIWGIAEQSGQQGGQVLWSHNQKTFTPYPRIVSFESINITGDSTVVMPTTPTDNSIPNKKYVDDKVSSSIGNGTITLTQSGNTMGTFTTNQSGDTTIALDGGSSYHPDLFDVKWADHQLNDVQWLRADTFSWQSGAVYQVAYQHLADDIDGKTLQSETISGTTIQFYLADDGHKICPASEESNVTAIYNATGVAWYYIIDTTNQRFKLPRTKFGFTGIRSGVGNYVEAGVPNITGGFTTDPNGRVISGRAFYSGETSGTNGYGTAIFGLRAIYLDASRSSSVYGNSDTVQPKATEMYLYFYVGNFTQAALENTAGLNTELFNGKVDVGHQVIAFQAPTAANNYTWYRKYADGWVEQGGLQTSTTGSSGVTVTLPVAMADANYTITATVTGEQLYFVCCLNKTATSFLWRSFNRLGEGYDKAGSWQVSGMAA